MRLDSAPSSVNKENSMTDYSGVNMVGFVEIKKKQDLFELNDPCF